MSDDLAFRHLLDLVRALRLAQKGNLAAGKPPDRTEAKRLETAVDYFIWSTTDEGRQSQTRCAETFGNFYKVGGY